MNKFKIGDVIQVQQSGYGFLEEDVGKWVEVTSSGASVVYVKEYEGNLVSLESKRWIESFGRNPVILLNTLEDKFDSRDLGYDEEYVKVAEGSKELVDKMLGISHDPVNKPVHYQLTESLEVKDLMKILLDRIEQSDIGFSHFQSSCYKEAMQYLLRFMLKNGYEDLAKAQVYLTEVIENKDK